MSLGGEAAHIDTDLGDDGLRGHDVDAIDLKLLETLREYWRWMEPRTYLFPGTVRNWRADVPVTEKIVWTAVAEAVQHLKELGMELSPQTADSFLLPIEDDIVLMAAVISNIKQLTVELERLLAESAETLLPTDTVQEIHYFTARVSSRPYNPTSAHDQGLYIRAFKTVPNLQITYGHFLTHSVSMYLTNVTPAQKVWVDKTEEKGSDVNLASHLLRMPSRRSSRWRSSSEMIPTWRSQFGSSPTDSDSL